ncbi:M23 family metallopeptidase [Synechococcus sp. PCC 6312]|uniref:M23 family metallopeptidase n=1 Tax=Synechococcus sp. (strain ATCC 27167 / PCC 6312) TaxID=195253 RepID=UPI00029EFA5D|nr:metalloendopeptidase-like membrane protein [Synechococcus sp. PCC 6312]
MLSTNRLGVTASTCNRVAQALNWTSKKCTMVTGLAVGVTALTLGGVSPTQAATLALPETTALTPVPGQALAFAPVLTGMGSPATLSLRKTTPASSLMPPSPFSVFAGENFTGFSPVTSDLAKISGRNSGAALIGSTLQALQLSLAGLPSVTGLDVDQEAANTAFKVVDLRDHGGAPYQDLTLDLTSIPKFAIPGYQAVGGNVYEELMNETEAASQSAPVTTLNSNAASTQPIALAPQNRATNPADASLPALDQTVLPQAAVTRSTAVSIGRNDQRIRLARTVTLPRTLPGITPPVSPTTPTTTTTSTSVNPNRGSARTTSSLTEVAPISLIARQSTAPTLPNIELPPLQPSDRYLPNSITLRFIWPAQGVLTSGFGPRWGRMHRGIDIAAPVGTPVLASAPGVITYARWNDGGYGNLVEIRHNDGTLTLYGHNQRLRVREGQYVQQGELIADMGSTGRSTGPHVHFEIRPMGRGAINPMLFLTRG